MPGGVYDQVLATQLYFQTTGAAEATADINKLASAAEGAGGKFTGLAKFGAHLGGAGRYEMMFIRGLTDAIDSAGNSWRGFASRMGETGAFAAAVIGFNLISDAAHELAKETAEVNKELGKLGIGAEGEKHGYRGADEEAWHALTDRFTGGGSAKSTGKLLWASFLDVMEGGTSRRVDALTMPDASDVAKINALTQAKLPNRKIDDKLHDNRTGAAYDLEWKYFEAAMDDARSAQRNRMKALSPWLADAQKGPQFAGADVIGSVEAYNASIRAQGAVPPSKELQEAKNADNLEELTKTAKLQLEQFREIQRIQISVFSMANNLF